MTSKWQYPTQLVHFSEGKKQIAVDRYKRRVPKTIISKETEREKREKKKSDIEQLHSQNSTKY